MRTRVVPLAAVFLLAAACADGPECGAPGTHSRLAADGSCVCEPGYERRDPSDEHDIRCVCQPQCGDRTCGPDLRCGGSCGLCDAPLSCSDAGQCDGACVPACGSRECGLDPLCGSRCGVCEAGLVCSAEGLCVGGGCVPDCGGRECGPDPVCGESCGACGGSEHCDAAGRCQSGACTPDCSGRECGPDPLCGESCGTCGVGEECDAAGQCNPCVPDCTGRDCGDDGCGGSCGTCALGEGCSAGLCELVECPIGSLECDGACVDFMNDENNCGYCGEVCPVLPGGLTECIAATCYAKCPGMEGERVDIDLDTDPANCGACGVECSSSIPTYVPACSGGVCVPPCDGGYADCGTGECLPITGSGYDPFPCGSCDTWCYPPADEYQSCSGGMCSFWLYDLGMTSACDSHCAQRSAACAEANSHTTVTGWTHNDITCSEVPATGHWVTVTTRPYPQDCWCANANESYNPTFDRISGQTCQQTCEAYGYPNCHNTQIPVTLPDGSAEIIWRPCEPPYGYGEPDWVTVGYDEQVTLWEEPVNLSCNCLLAPY